MTVLHHDYESRSELDLSEVGLDRYVRHPSTRLLLMGWAFDDDPVQIWEPHLGSMPADVLAALKNPQIKKSAWNSQFERVVAKHLLKIDTGFQEWEDPMIQARYCSMPGSLEDCCHIVGLAEGKITTKIKVGRGKDDKESLVKFFCEPVHQGGEETMFGVSEPVFRDWQTNPDEWTLFKEYCKRDVETEREIGRKLTKYYPLPDIEKRGFALDQAINDRGIPIDSILVSGAMKVAERAKAELRDRLNTLMGVENPNSNPQILEWVRNQGYPFNSLGKGFVTRALECPDLTPAGREALTIRKESSKTSDSKLDAIAANVGPDARLRYQFSFLGSSRAGRWSAKAVQPHNMPRPDTAVKKRLDRALELLRLADFDAIKAEFPSPINVVVSALRSAFKASPGKKFVVCDLSGIEFRLLGYLAGSTRIPEMYRTGVDPYKDFATSFYNVAYEDVTDDQRQVCKVPILGCFTADTLVLSDRGWVPIVEIENSDKVFDGLDFVSHSGIIYQGRKPTINLLGIGVTPDHLIQTDADQWSSAWDVNQSTRLGQQAIALASGKLSAFCIGAEKPPISVDAWDAVLKSQLISRTWREDLRRSVFDARVKELFKSGTVCTHALTLIQDSRLIGSPTYTMRSHNAAVGGVMRPTAMRDVESDVSSPMFTVSLSTSLPLKGGITRVFRLIASRTTDTTPLGTSVLLRQRLTTAIKKIFDLWNGTVARCRQPSSGNSIAQNIGATEPSVESCDRESRPNKLSPSKAYVEEPTFDVLNAGPRHRFMILTTEGPLLVHNCGYRLSGGEERINKDGDLELTGLMGYAKNYSVVMDSFEADRAVKLFRERYPEVVRLWYQLEEACQRALYGVPTQVGHIKFEMVGKVLCVRLPSGRSLHYINPKVEKREFYGSSKDTFCYDGVDQKTKQWTRIATHGGKTTQNLCEAIGRDILLADMFAADAMGYEIFLHCHDEIGAEVPENSPLGLPQLKAIMETSPIWASDLPLGAEGYEDFVYRK